MDYFPTDIQDIINGYAVDTEQCDKVINVLTLPRGYLNSSRKWRLWGIQNRDKGTQCLTCKYIQIAENERFKFCTDCAWWWDYKGVGTHKMAEQLGRPCVAPNISALVRERSKSPPEKTRF